MSILGTCTRILGIMLKLPPTWTRFGINSIPYALSEHRSGWDGKLLACDMTLHFWWPPAEPTKTDISRTKILITQESSRGLVALTMTNMSTRSFPGPSVAQKVVKVLEVAGNQGQRICIVRHRSCHASWGRQSGTLVNTHDVLAQVPTEIERCDSADCYLWQLPKVNRVLFSYVEDWPNLAWSWLQGILFNWFWVQSTSWDPYHFKGK